MNFEGYQPTPIPRFGSLVQSDDPTNLPFGVARAVRNCHFRTQTVGPRDGKAVRLKFGAQDSSIGGFGVLRYLAPDNSGDEDIQIIATTQQDGNVWAAAPFLQSSVQQLTSDAMLQAAGLLRTTGLFAQCCQAYNKMYIARGNLMTGTAAPLIVNGATLTCDPISDKPFGDVWQANTSYRAGQVVSPTSQTSDLFYCTVGGTTGINEPFWPTVTGGTVIDGQGVGNITWTKINILCTSGLSAPGAPVVSVNAPGAAVAPGATIFLVCTWTNQYGESTANVANADGTTGNIVSWTNTTGVMQNVGAVLPSVTADIAVLPPQYAVTRCNLYGYIVAGTPDPTLYRDPTSYAYIGSGAPGTTLTVTSMPIGASLPQANDAYTTAAGHVSSGVRYMIVLYMTRTGYICGFSGPQPIRCDISVDGRQMLVQNIPLGPYNCVARICAFTVAGQGSDGPYFYIASDDYVDPGLGEAKIKQTATKIPDNITTAVYFDFLDKYLEGASEVTDYFDRIEVPPCSDVFYSKILDRVCYTGARGYPSATLISDLEDGEAIRVPGSIVQLSQTDGDRAVCVRDFGTTPIAYKENSAFAITPNDGDPSDWSTGEALWVGSGPCGPRAIDVALNDTEKFHVFAHRTGGFVWQGSGAPTNIVKELIGGTEEQPGMWDRINWSRSYLISVRVNLTTREVYFHVPLDGATSNSHRITVNYANGWDEPIVFVVRSGREVPNINGRKWSVDDLAVNDCVYLPQRTAA